MGMIDSVSFSEKDMTMLQIGDCFSAGRVSQIAPWVSRTRENH